jgi:hypothetical protein
LSNRIAELLQLEVVRVRLSQLVPEVKMVFHCSFQQSLEVRELRLEEDQGRHVDEGLLGALLVLILHLDLQLMLISIRAVLLLESGGVKIDLCEMEQRLEPVLQVVVLDVRAQQMDSAALWEPQQNLCNHALEHLKPRLIRVLLLDGLLPQLHALTPRPSTGLNMLYQYAL